MKPVQSPVQRDTSAPPVLAHWEFAGLMVTYWCNAKCAFCYVYSGPDRGGDMEIDAAVRLWRGLDRSAAAGGLRMRIHLAGGEPFGDWPRLLGIVRAARNAGLTPLEKVETNGFWATDDDLTRVRLEQLAALGMEKLIISADVYHQEFVPLERVRRLVHIARAVLGNERVRVRWWDFLSEPEITRQTPNEQKAGIFARALARHKDRITGRAADRLGDLLPLEPMEAFAHENCVREVLHSKHVHIDPYNNVFPGVCAGIILGNATQREVDDVWDDLSENWRDNPVVDAVVAGGSTELARRAAAFGFAPRVAGYANKCHLCTDARQYLHDRGVWSDAIGPAECYMNERDRAEAREFAAAVQLTIRGAVVE